MYEFNFPKGFKTKSNSNVLINIKNSSLITGGRTANVTLHSPGKPTKAFSITRDGGAYELQQTVNWGIGSSQPFDFYIVVSGNSNLPFELSFESASQ